MMVWYVFKLMKAIGVIYLISTALFIALNKEGVINASQLHYLRCKIDTASFYKVSCLPVRSKQPF